MPAQGRADDAACELGRCWVAAFNSRHADGLIALAHAEIEFHPTILSGGRNVYHGHDGLARWLEDLAALNSQHTVKAGTIRCASPGDLVIAGEILLGEEAVSPFSMRMRLQDGKVISAHAYLSDEALLASLGHLDAD